MGFSLIEMVLVVSILLLTAVLAIPLLNNIMNAYRLRSAVSAVTAVGDAVVSTTSARDMPAGWRTLTARAWAERSFSDFWQYCLVAEGSVDVAADETLQLWDYAAVQVIVEEAGGRCTTFAGSDPAPGGSFVATNGPLHDKAVGYLSPR